MRTWCIAAAVLTLSFLSYVASAGQFGGQGYYTSYPPQKGVDTPHLKTPQDTTLIAPEGPREAQLVCLQQAPVRRLVLCDIITWDVCGNIDGEPGNTTDWRASVKHVNSNKYSRLVSPIIYLEKGVARFHWTPTHVGVHEVRVWRHQNSLMPDLTTPDVMTFMVIVHDTVAKCSVTQASNFRGELQRIMWAQASFTNEKQAIYGLEGKESKRTTVVEDIDPYEYRPRDSNLQQNLRRPPVLPSTNDLMLNGFREVKKEFDYCELIKATSKVLN